MNRFRDPFISFFGSAILVVSLSYSTKIYATTLEEATDNARPENPNHDPMKCGDELTEGFRTRLQTLLTNYNMDYREAMDDAYEAYRAGDKEAENAAVDRMNKARDMVNWVKGHLEKLPSLHSQHCQQIEKYPRWKCTQGYNSFDMIMVDSNQVSQFACLYTSPTHDAECGPTLIECGPTGPDDKIEGCTDSTANNHNPDAEINDGSCQYDQTPSDFEEEFVEGCRDQNATNYNSNATQDDGSCHFGAPDDYDDSAPDPTNDGYSEDANNNYQDTSSTENYTDYETSPDESYNPYDDPSYVDPSYYDGY